MGRHRRKLTEQFVFAVAAVLFRLAGHVVLRGRGIGRRIRGVIRRVRRGGRGGSGRCLW